MALRFEEEANDGSFQCALIPLLRSGVTSSEWRHSNPSWELDAGQRFTDFAVLVLQFVVRVQAGARFGRDVGFDSAVSNPALVGDDALFERVFLAVCLYFFIDLIH